jgi:integrase
LATGTGRAQNQSNVRNRMLAGSVRLANERRKDVGLGPLPDGLTPHSLRGTFISLLLAAGDDPAYVMRQVGHRDPKVTLGIYAQVMLRKDGEREQLQALVRGGTGVADPRPDSSSQVTA